MTTLLSFETSTPGFSMALCHEGVFYHHAEVAPQQHARKLLVQLNTFLEKANLSLAQLEGIITTRGPGSFTGVRTGIAVAQGLSLGLNCPIYAFSTLMVFAEQQYRLTGAEQVSCQLDARQNEVYWGAFERQANGCWLNIEAERVARPEQLPSLKEPWVGIQQPPFYPDALDALNLCLNLLNTPHIGAYTYTPETLEAVYLRNPI